jgi:hydroxymethylpyrimidine/phosphomethylpyrimidine kinase
MDFSVPMIGTKNIHGTGCTFSAAIAALLGLGCELEQAISGAKKYITSTIQSGKDLKIGRGNGPVDFFAE